MHEAQTDRTERRNKQTHKFLSQYSIEQVDKLSGRIQNINCVCICLEADAKVGFNMKAVFVGREQKKEDAFKQAQCRLTGKEGRLGRKRQ